MRVVVGPVVSSDAVRRDRYVCRSLQRCDRRRVARHVALAGEAHWLRSRLATPPSTRLATALVASRRTPPGSARPSPPGYLRRVARHVADDGSDGRAGASRGCPRAGAEGAPRAVVASQSRESRCDVSRDMSPRGRERVVSGEGSPRAGAGRSNRSEVGRRVRSGSGEAGHRAGSSGDRLDVALLGSARIWRDLAELAAVALRGDWW
jgi:hypothetical protein